MDIDLLSPRERANLVGCSDLEAGLRAAMESGVLSHGWIIAGPEGAGKATLAYRLARGLLEPEALSEKNTFNMPETARTFRLISLAAHPDVFVAERLWDEKKNKYQSEITVETIRKLTAFLNRTASGGGARIAIVDTADDMNRNAANALLKALEEPPEGALLILLSTSPGRLLPTIRSRCRRIDMPTVSDESVEAFLTAEGVDQDQVKNIALHARGRPGYALQLAANDGANAIGLALAFFKAVRANENLSLIISNLIGKAGEGRWPVFRDTVITTLSDAARTAASGNVAVGFEEIDAAGLLQGWQSLTELVHRGEALNLDRAQLIEAMAYDLKAALHQKAA